MKAGFSGLMLGLGEDRHAEGFQVTFDNRVTVSVQFGEFHYCGQRRNRTPGECGTAEVAIIGKDGGWLTREWRRGCGDDVEGRQSPKDVLNALKWAEKQVTS